MIGINPERWRNSTKRMRRQRNEKCRNGLKMREWYDKPQTIWQFAVTGCQIRWLRQKMNDSEKIDKWHDTDKILTEIKLMTKCHWIFDLRIRTWHDIVDKTMTVSDMKSLEKMSVIWRYLTKTRAINYVRPRKNAVKMEISMTDQVQALCFNIWSLCGSKAPRLKGYRIVKNARYVKIKNANVKNLR